ALLSTASNLLTLYFIAILLGVILSWVAPDGYSPAHALIYALTEPVLNPIRRVVPAVGGFDFSPLIALLAIGFVQRLLNV
ncbi:MAG: YggT family protein, partial [Steroidobacteraceae bacterium]|nr:YggT family protein [Steroidobacteraceae bacterium]MDW8259554.1 YggT family protein [Gammaproteobacteria bacterium]